MNNNSEVLICLCSHLCKGENIVPLEPAEWAKLAQQLVECKKEPKDLINFSHSDFVTLLGFDDAKIDRITSLLSRAASLAFEMEKLQSMGINIVTRADAIYPPRLRKILKQGCPPLFYYAGDLNLLLNDFVGVVGSRTIDVKDNEFAKMIVTKAVSDGFSIVSGGAKGIDSTATLTALENGGTAVEFLSDSMIKKLKDVNSVRHIRENKLLLLSANKPDAGFNVGLAMQRNKYIYAQSMGTFVIKSDLKKGGTWNGALDAIRHNLCPVLCWNNEKYKGNLELIAKGATAISDFDKNMCVEEYNQLAKKEAEPTSQQLSFFEED